MSKCPKCKRVIIFSYCPFCKIDAMVNDAIAIADKAILDVNANIAFKAFIHNNLNKC